MGSDWTTVREILGVKLQSLDRWAARNGAASGRAWRVLRANGAVATVADEAAGLAALMAEAQKGRLMRVE